KSVGLILRATNGDDERAASAAVEGALMGLFEPDKYRTIEKEERQIERLLLIAPNADDAALKRGAERGHITGESVNFTRDLANEPGAYMTPTIMAERAREIAEQFGLEFHVLEREQMEQEGMGALLSVARGSDEPPKLIVLKYTPEGAGQEENAAPGDVVRAMNGKTIEVINTDAEGRLILADAVCYAKKLGATRVVDMATLTGAVSIALGDVNVAILGTDQALIDEVIAAGRDVGEKFWQLPLDKEYTRQIKSDIADIKNIGGRKAGTITAAAFIKEFADGLSWAHLDIAGTAWGDEAKPYRAKGPTGIAVRT